MDCCYSNDCEQFSTTPILFTPCTPVKFCESTPVCIPCVPSCNQQQIIYCCEKPQQSLPRLKKVYNDSHCDDCDPCHLQSTQKPRSQHKRCFDTHSQEYCPTCHQPTATPVKPVKTKYIMPCYRYEDGRIEQYVPKVHGRLPTSAFRRNGMQDQIVGYRGAIRYLCAMKKHDKHYICTSVDPIRRIYPKITQEVFPVQQMNKNVKVSPGVNCLPSSALKRNGLQDQKFIEGGGISYLRKCCHAAVLTDNPIIPIELTKKRTTVKKL